MTEFSLGGEMKNRKKILAVALVFGIAGVIFSAVKPKPTQAQTSAETEKQKALQNPYANDLGPESVDVSKYPPEAQAGYKEFKTQCLKCHAVSRPLNSEFLQVKAEELAALKKSNPELFSNPLIWNTDAGIWQRYVKRMQSKPGCEMPNERAKSIYKFLVHDSRARKMGKNAASWKMHRQKLLADFKVKYPARHKELYEKK